MKNTAIELTDEERSVIREALDLLYSSAKEKGVFVNTNFYGQFRSKDNFVKGDQLKQIIKEILNRREF